MSYVDYIVVDPEDVRQLSDDEAKHAHMQAVGAIEALHEGVAVVGEMLAIIDAETVGAAHVAPAGRLLHLLGDLAHQISEIQYVTSTGYRAEYAQMTRRRV